jgi:hypothetical protein
VSNLFVAYDTRSGRIIGVHSAPADANYKWNHKYGTHEHVAIIRTASFECGHGKQYKIDTSRKALVECASDEYGVSFGFGRTASMPDAAGE